MTDGVKKKSLTRRAGRIAIGIFIAAIAFILLALAALQTGYVKKRLADTISHLASSENFKLELEGLDGALPWSIRLDKLTLADKEGEWLTGADLKIDWEMKAILKGRLSFPLIGADKLVFHRPSQSEEKQEESKPFSLDDLYLPPVSIGDLSVKQFRTMYPEGAPRDFSIKGGFESGTDKALVKLAVVGLDGPVDELNITAGLAGKPAELSVRAVFKEEPEGILGKLLFPDVKTPLDVELTGKGPLEDWNGSLKVDIPEFGLLNTAITMAKADGLALGLKGDLEAEKIVPASLLEHTGSKVEFDIKAGLSEENLLTIDHFKLLNEKIQAGLSGRLDLETDVIDASLSLKSETLPALASKFGVALDATPEVKVHATGILDQPKVQLLTGTSKISYQGRSVENSKIALAVSLPAALNKGFSGLIASGKISLKGLVVPEAQIQNQDLDIEFTASSEKFDRIMIQKLSLDGCGLKANINGDFWVEGLKLDARAGIAVPEIKQIGPVAATGLSGAVVLDAGVRGNLDEPDLVFDLKANVNKLAGLPEQALIMAGKDISLKSRGRFKGGVVELPSVEINGASTLTANGRVDLNMKGLNLDWRLQAPKLPTLVAGYGLKISGIKPVQGKINGSFDKLALETKISCAGLAYDKLQFQNLSAGIKAGIASGNVNGNLILKAISGKENINLSTKFAVSESKAGVSELKLNVPGTRVSADLSMALKSTLADGRIRLKSDDLAGLYFLTGQRMAGSAELKIDLKGKSGRQSADISLAAGALAWNDLDIRKISLQGSSGDLYNPAAARGKLKINGCRYAEYDLKTVRADLTGSGRGAAFKIRARGKALKPFSLDTRGEISIGRQDAELTIKTLSGAFGGQRFKLKKTAKLSTGGGRSRIENLDFRLGTGSLIGSGELSPKTVKANFKLKKIPLSLTRGLSPVNLSGRIDGSLSVSGSPGKPDIKAGLTINKLKPSTEDLSFPETDLAVELDWRGQTMSVRANLTGLGREPGQVEISLPAALSLQPFSFQLNEKGPLNGKAVLGLNLASLSDIIGLDGQEIKGQADLDVSIRGSVAAPMPSGSISIKDCRYENFITGTVLENATAEMSARDYKFVVDKLTATDGDKGRLNGSGSFGFDPKGKFPFEIRLDMDHAYLVRLDVISAAGTGFVALKGNSEKADFQGKITIDPAEVNIPDQLPPGIADLEIEEINKKDGKPAKIKKKKQGSFGLGLDLSVDVPGRFFVRGRGLESEWKGNVTLIGTSEKYSVRGELDIIKGRFNFLDRLFNLEEGTLSLAGGSPPSPFINVKGKTKFSDITAEVTLSGPVEKPEIKLESDPALPQDEILARILFGRSMDTMTPIQAIQLAQAVRTLTGGGGPGIMDKTRKVLGVDRLELKQGEQGGTAVGVGKYLNEKVYVEAEKDLDKGGDKITVEIELSPEFSLESEVGSDSRGGVMFNWKHDY